MAFGNKWFDAIDDWRCYRQIQRSLQGQHDQIAESFRSLLPNFIIIGAAKSATTSLATVLGQHPEIQISSSMEPKFFGRNYQRGWEWYASQFAGSEHKQFRGEASTMYSSSYRSYRQTPQLIHHHLGAIKLIYLVRHPLERIQSHWRHWNGRIETCPPFDQILRSKRLRQRVVDASLYHQQWSRYREWFPHDAILTMTTAELTDRPRQSIRRILRFLGADSSCKGLLEQGQLPLTNPAGAKGRRAIPLPCWNPELKRDTIELIRPDSERFLQATGRPLDTWTWD